MSNDFASTFCCSTAVRTGLHNTLYLSRTIASLGTSSNLPEILVYVRSDSNVTRVDEVNDVTSVTTELQQCAGRETRHTV